LREENLEEGKSPLVFLEPLLEIIDPGTVLSHGNRFCWQSLNRFAVEANQFSPGIGVIIEELAPAHPVL